MFCPKCKGEMTRDDKGFYVCPDCGAKFRSQNPTKAELQNLETDNGTFARSNASAYVGVTVVLFIMSVVLTVITNLLTFSLVLKLVLYFVCLLLTLAYTICLIKAVSYGCIDKYDTALKKSKDKAAKELKTIISQLQNKISALETTLVEFKANAEREKADVRNTSETERE